MHDRHLPFHPIRLRVKRFQELFNSCDPTPFHHCALDVNIERYLESAALDAHQAAHFHLLVEIDSFPETDPQAVVSEAIHNYFGYKTVLASHQLGQLFSEGRVSLVIGISFLGVCLLAADGIAAWPEAGRLARVLQESLMIGGWVAMWRPMQTFLYDWWPLAHRRRVYQRLGRASIAVVPHRVDTAAPNLEPISVGIAPHAGRHWDAMQGGGSAA